MTDAWGIDHQFADAGGQTRHVSPETIDGLRAALGKPETPPGPVVTRSGESIDLGDGEVHLEDGTTLDAGVAASGGLPLGYHQLIDQQGASRPIIVSPGHCHLPPDLRAWGWASQLYGTRSERSWGIGDLSDLARLARWSRRRGAGFTLISPIVASAPAGTQEPNPYYPASRRYRSPLYLSIDDVPGSRHATGRLEAAARAGRALNERGRVDHDSVWRIKLTALEAIWGSTRPPREFDEWLVDQPDSLRLFATWCVLTERHGPSWHRWPAELRRPDGDAVREVGESEHDRVRFYAWLQWCIESQLADAGRELAVIQDLPIGFDPGGFDAWEWQDLLALGASVGAPPDAFNSEGQDWGSSPFIPWRLRAAGYQPFIETVRANLATGGGLRIDHVMGLWRLWCIPAGVGPVGGAYVRYPAHDLLSILALESRRAEALVVGEDLGTVEEGVRGELSARNMLSYRLLWFEPDSPEDWPVEAMAAVTTHDLPTVAGLWSGSDLEEGRSLGLATDPEGIRAMRRRLAEQCGLEDDAGAEEAILGAYRQLSRAPSRLLSATLEDAVCEARRPNMPGASGRHLNWRLALPVPLEEIDSHPLAEGISGILREATEGRSGKDANG